MSDTAPPRAARAGTRAATKGAAKSGDGAVAHRGTHSAPHSARGGARATRTAVKRATGTAVKGATGTTAVAVAEVDPFDERAGRFSSSLRAGLAILSRFSSERPVLGIANLADQLSMSRSTTHRYASTLVALGYLEQDNARRYRLAPRVIDVGMSVLDAMALRGVAREHLRELREQTGRTVSLAVLDGDGVRYIDRLHGWRRGQYAVDLDLGVGARVPANCSAMGKVLLAGLAADERDTLLARLELPKRGPNSLTSKRALRSELEQVLADGYAVGDEELAPGVRTLAAPVTGPDGAVLAAIGMPVPADAFSREELLEVLLPPLRASARRISAALASR
jgi:IclR family pca regulon transcriptional regulator